jgi:hypothetical protein
MNIILGENLEELDFILKKIKNLNSSFYIVPLNLDSMIFCNEKKINFLNPINFIENKFHEKVLISSDQLLNNLDYGMIEPESLRKDYKNYIRKKYNQFYFSYFLINEMIKSKNIKNIYVSGWETYSNDKARFNKNYYITSIVNEYFKDKVKIISVSSNKKENIQENCYNYILTPFKYSKRKKVLITSRGYNTYRLILVCLFLRHSVHIISENPINFILKYISSFFGINFLTFKKQTINKVLDFKIRSIKFIFDNIDFSNLLNISRKVYELKLSDTYFKSRCVKKLLEKEKIDLVISVIARGYQGCAVDFAKKLKIKTLGITHGTISKSFTKIDEIYKKIISEAVFSKNYNFFPLQTKISYDAVDTHSLPKPDLKTGNLIFAENLIKIGKKNKILYAVTSKNFNQMHFHGVELYFEFYKNLELLNNLAKSSGYIILVNLHPSVSNYSHQHLKGSFTNLSFTKKKISSCLKNAFVTVSFSSTVIEDSICSNVPIILFDNWKRYKHCESENRFFNEPKPIYYVNSINDLKICIESIKNKKKIDFSNLKYGGSCFKNIYSLLRKII